MKCIRTKNGDRFEVIKELKDRYQIKPKNTKTIVIDNNTKIYPEKYAYYVSKEYVVEVEE